MKNRTKTQKGSALVYILIAIALLAALTATFMDSSSQQTSSQNTFNTVTELNSQINFIRSAIQECVLTFPAGDDGLIGSNNIPYPINPNSTYLVDPATDSWAREMRCPGNPGNSNDHAAIFGGSSGKFLPPPPKLFRDWYYYNGVDGVYIMIVTDVTDPYIKTALAKLDDQYSECEADIVDSSGGSSVLTTDGQVCPSPFVCFRVWMLTQPTAVYNGDADNDEASCP